MSGISPDLLLLLPDEAHPIVSCPFMCIPNMQIFRHVKQSAVLSLQV